MKPTRRLFALTTLACAALAATGTALAQFPDKPLRIVVGAPAGGTADIIARTLSEGLAQQLGQPVMVDNKPGGAGLIGLQEVLKAGNKNAQASRFILYPGVGHAFHADYRPSYRKEAAEDGWKRALAWFKANGVA